MSEAYRAKQAKPDNRLFMFYQMHRSKDLTLAKLRQQIQDHPAYPFIKGSLLYAYIHRSYPEAGLSFRDKRKKHEECLYELLDVLDTITYGKTGIRNSN